MKAYSSGRLFTLLIAIWVSGCATRMPIPAESVTLVEGVEIISTNLAASMGGFAKTHLISAKDFLDVRNREVVEAGVDVTEKLIVAIKAHGYNIEKVSKKNQSASRYSLDGTIEHLSISSTQGTQNHVFQIVAYLFDRDKGHVAIAKEVVKVSVPEWIEKPQKWFVPRIQGPTFSGGDKRTETTINALSISVGEKADPDYIAQEESGVEGLLNDAAEALDRGKYAEAISYYSEAAELPQGLVNETFKGLYVAYMGLDEVELALKAFRKQLEISGASRNMISVRFLFEPNSQKFKPSMVNEYKLWIPVLAQVIKEKGSCVEIVGHCSVTGDPIYNEDLSLARANALKDYISRASYGLSRKISTKGMGYRMPLVGSGTDDEMDAMDRRVEFLFKACD